MDQMNNDSLHDGFALALEKCGQVDILINNGLDALGKDLTSVTFEEFARHQVVPTRKEIILIA